MLLSDISKSVSLSIPAVSERIKKLENKGYINGYTTILNSGKFNKNLICFCLLTLQAGENNLQNFKKIVISESDILECHCITGDYEYLLKIITEGPESLEKLLSLIRVNANVIKSTTSITLSTLKEKPSYQPD